MMKLLAPNGKPSNLTPEQYRLVRTPAFKAWFGDWENSPETASKVVDENGEPLICYHGTKKYDRFYKFRKGSKGYLGGGIYFTSNKEKSKDYARYGTMYGNQYEVFLDIKEPFNVTGSIGADDFLNKLYGRTSIYKKRSDKQSFDTMIVKSSDVKKLLDKGYDGIFWNLAEEFVVYEPNQIKLADGTNTTFDSNNPDIRYNNGGLTMKAPKLLAPNGKPSNLTAEQYRLVRTPEFKKWFGDWENSPETASKIVDENGEPLVCYHATNKKFTVFDKNKIGTKNDSGTLGRGFYFDTLLDIQIRGDGTPITTWATKIILKCFLNIKNPKISEDVWFWKKGESVKYTNKIIKEGYDGILVEGYYDGRYYPHWCIAFEPNQIKLADGTNTTFDSNNPDIRYADGGSITDLLSSQEVADKLGRELHWWNDDIVYLSGIKYKKVYLRPEYKKVFNKLIDIMYKPVLLPYSYSDLEPSIDAETMNVHYNKHYLGYLNNLNDEFKKYDLPILPIQTLIKNIDDFSQNIRNNAGGYYNHSLFWKMLTPINNKSNNLPIGISKNIIDRDFGSFEMFKKLIENTAKKRFGSGWVWWIVMPNGQTRIVETPYQDNPQMYYDCHILLGIDVWEHAYYLKYKADRMKYVNNIFDIINWDYCNKILSLFLYRK